MQRRPLRGVRRRPAGVALLALVLILALLSACSPFGGQESTTAAGPAPRSAAASGEQVLNVAGGSFDPPTLDPALAQDSQSQFFIRHLFSGLLALNEQLEVAPDLAESLPQVSDDGRVYTFKLRPNAKFQGGRQVTAQDVKYSIERAADPALAAPDPPSALPAATYLSDVAGVLDKLEGRATEVVGVQVKDDRTVQFEIDAPKSYFLAKLAGTTAFVVDRENVEKDGAGWTRKPVGTGPFKLAEWRTTELIRLVRNDDYYGGPPALVEVNVWLGVHATQPMIQYEKGQLDLTEVPLSDLDRVLDRSNPLNKQLIVQPQLSLHFLGLNTRVKPFDDPKVRKALAHALDREKVARVMMEDKVEPAGGILPPRMPGYDGRTGGLGYDLSQARQLLAESTYKDARALPRITLYTAGERQTATLLKEVYEKSLGIELEIRSLQWKDFLDGMSRREFPAFLITWSADYPDPQNFLEVLFHSKSSSNFGGYANPAVDRQLESAGQERNSQKRLQAYAQIEAQIVADAPIIPLYYSSTYVLRKPYVKGLQVTALGTIDLKGVSISK